MRQKKVNSKKRINTPLFTLSFATTNRNDPKTVYLEGSSFITPLSEGEYKTRITILRKEFIKEVGEILEKSENFRKENITIIEVPYERMKQGKKSYLYFQCHMKQKNLLSFNDIFKKSTVEINNVIGSLDNIVRENGFAISKTK